jgi:hypothetical protein
MTFHPIPSEFLIYEENIVFFFIRVEICGSGSTNKMKKKMLIYLPVGQPFSVRQLQIRRIAQGRRLPISAAVCHHSVAAVDISETALRRNTRRCYRRRRVLHNIPEAPAAVLRARAAISAVRDLQYSTGCVVILETFKM